MADIELKYIRGRGKIKSDFLDDIRAHFSVPNERYEIEIKTNPMTRERFYAIDYKGEFDLGMFMLIYKYLKEKFEGFTISIDPELKNVALPSITDVDIVDLGLEERYYQKDTIKSAFKSGRGICKLGTGAGKTYVMATMLESIYRKNDMMTAIVFVPTLALVNQTYDDFKEYGCTFSFSKWTGTKEYDSNSKVIIALTKNFLSKADPSVTKYEKRIYNSIKNKDDDQIKKYYTNLKSDDVVYKALKAFYKKDKKKDFKKTDETYKCLTKIKKKLDEQSKNANIIGNLMMFADYVFYDECHGINNTSKITTFVEKFVTKNKFGFTGTTSKDKMDYWKCVGVLGPVIYSKKSKELRDEGYLTNAIIKILLLKHRDLPDYERGEEAKLNWQKEVEFCANSEFRNNLMKKIIQQLDKNSLLIVERIEQGEILYNVLSQIPNKKVYFIRGEMEDDERERIKKEMEERDDVICIAISKIFSVGVSINNIHYLFFVNIGKSFIKVIQTIGRGLRRHESKNKVVIFDIADDLIYSDQHLQKRIEFYEEEQFNYNIKEFVEK
jgi:superfamily II DNA or RNA helicase